jgi:tRNA(fMet)-specific endonuclease VapC
MILFDTDTFTLDQRGHAQLLERHREASEVPAITIVTQIEVLRGRFEAVLKASDGKQLLRAQQILIRSRQHLALFRAIPFDEAAATEFDRLTHEKKLKKIGRADLLIAAIALPSRATLVTRNLRHFLLVPGLKVENWAD